MMQYLRVDRELIKDVAVCPKCKTNKYLLPTDDYNLNVGCAVCNMYFKIGSKISQ